MKKAIVSVINDLVTDQRVNKSCLALQEAGYEVLLVGRVKHDSPSMPSRSYRTHRMKLLFEKGPVFYAEFNIRLFFVLLFRKTSLLFSNDLDTLLPNFLISKLRGKTLIYDSHEYFTETPELVNRKFVQKTWKAIESWIFPKLKNVITVNNSIAQLFESQYHTKVHVVRNIPPSPTPSQIKSREELGMPADKKIILLQGSGINIQRGAEELVSAMAFTTGVHLYIIGGGDVIDILKQMAKKDSINDKITFLPRMPFDQLQHYTANADIGLSLDKDTNLNYRFSLPNKLFDYINAGVPVLASPMVEIKKIIDKYQVGETISSHEPGHIAGSIQALLQDSGKMTEYRKNCLKASEELNWQHEKQILLDILTKHE